MFRLRSILINIFIISATISAKQSFLNDDTYRELTFPKPDAPVTTDNNSNNNNNNNSEKDGEKKGEHGTLDSVGRSTDKALGEIRDGVTSAVDADQNGMGRTLHSVVDNTNNTITKVHNSVDKIVDKIDANFNKKVDTVEKIEIKISNETTGLDTEVALYSRDNFKTKVDAIYPGTKWCGDGDIASDYDDLGEHAGTDACCRQHDLCPDNILAGKSKYGLKNIGIFTRSHCDCDKKFYECLEIDGSTVSKRIGFTYFTILGPQCFKKDYPIIGCNKSINRKCIDYEFGKTSEQLYQWFDSPTFKYSQPLAESYSTNITLNH